jgi:uncharacterized protein YndB with AHSA1/START domain
MDFDPKSFAPINISQFFPVAPESVFAAWTEPDIMRRWLFVGRCSEIQKIDMDLRVGGAFSIVERRGREVIDHFGEYRKVAPPHNLAFTLQVPKHFPGITNVIIGIVSTPDGAVMDFQQTGVACEVTHDAWLAMFMKLAEILAPPDAKAVPA